jgi:hypothetical protein
MTSKRDSLSKRWRAAVKEAKHLRLHTWLADNASGGKTSEAAIRAAMTINTGNLRDRNIQRLFDKLGRDPTNILDWREVMGTVSAVLTPEPGKRGARRKWDINRWGALLKDYKDLKDRFPKESETRICQRLAKTGRYGSNPATIRRQLQNAKNPDVNPVLSFYLDQVTIAYRVWCFRRGTWSRIKEASYRKKRIPLVIDLIATSGGFLREK